MIIINSNELIIVLYGFAFATPLLEMFYFAIFPGAKREQSARLCHSGGACLAFWH